MIASLLSLITPLKLHQIEQERWESYSTGRELSKNAWLCLIFYKFLSKWTFCLLRPFWAKSAAISEFQQNLQMFITWANFHQFQKSWWVLESIFHGQQDSNLSNSSPTIFYWLFEQFIWMYVQNLLNIPFLIIFFKTTII